MTHRPYPARIALGLVVYCSLALAGACLDFGGLSGGAPADAGGADRIEVDASSSDASEPDASAAGIVLRGTAQAGPDSAEVPLELSIPAGVQPGDLMLLALSSSRGLPAAKFTPDGGTSGWTRRFGVRASCEDGGATSSTPGLTVLSKTASEREESLSIIFDIESTKVDRSSAILAVWGGTDPSSPIDTEIFAQTADLRAPTLTTTVANALLTAIFMNPDGTSASWTPPTGMAPRASTGVLALFDEPLRAAGPTGERAAQSTVSTLCGAAAMIALRPAP